MVNSEAVLTVIANDSVRPIAVNSFSKLHALDVKILDGGTLMIVKTKGNVISLIEATEGDEEAFIEGEALSLDITRSTFYAVCPDGKLFSFLDGQISLEPRFSSLVVKQVACGFEHVLILTEDRSVYATGSGPQTGLDTDATITKPHLIEGLKHVVSIHAGPSHSVAIVRQTSCRHMAAGKTDTVTKRKNSKNIFPLGNKGNSTKSVLERRPCLGRTKNITVNSGERYSDEFLKVKRLNAPDICSPLSIPEELPLREVCVNELQTSVVVWGSGKDYQLGLGNESDQPVPVPLPGFVDVVKIACGATHTVAVTLNDKFWAWGNILDSNDANVLKTPTQVNHGFHILEVSCGDKITLTTVYEKKDPQPKVAVLAREPKRGLCLQLRELMEEDKLLQVISCSKNETKGVAILQKLSLKEDQLRKKIHAYCSLVKEYIPKMETVKCSFFRRNDQLSENVSPFLHGFFKLIDQMELVKTFSFMVVDWLTSRTTRLPQDEMLEERLFRILHEHMQCTKNYFIQLYRFQMVNGFQFMKDIFRESDNEVIVRVDRKMLTEQALEDTFSTSVPGIDHLEQLVEQFLQVVQNNEDMLCLYNKVEKATKKVQSFNVDRLELKRVFGQHSKLELEMLYRVEGNYILTSGPRTTRSAPVTVKQKDSTASSEFQFDDSSVFITDRSIVFLRTKRNRTSIFTEWKLFSMWMDMVDDAGGCSSANTMELTFPETKLLLTCTEFDDFNRWKRTITDCIQKCFTRDQLDISSMSWLKKRNFGHTYMFGPKEGCEYFGEWENGFPQGNGEMTVPADKVRRPGHAFTHYGEFKQGCRNGFGTCYTKVSDLSLRQIIEERWGVWKDDKMEGFGMSQFHSKIESSGKYEETSYPEFKGHFSADKKNGYGIMEVNDEICFGRWKNDQRSGEMMVISLKDKHHGAVIDCRFTDDAMQEEVNGRISGQLYTFNGTVNAERQPDGQGCLVLHVTREVSVVINGQLTMDHEGTVRVKDGTVKMKKTSGVNCDHVFSEENGPSAMYSTTWINLVEQCLSVLMVERSTEVSKSSPVKVDDRELSLSMWDQMMRKFCSEYDSEGKIPVDDLEYFMELVDRQEFSDADLLRMANFVKNLYEVPAFPITVFMNIRFGILSTPIGLAVKDTNRLREIVLKDLHNLMVEFYHLLRRLFPALPTNIADEIRVADQTETKQGFDFAYACLPRRVYALLFDVVNHSCNELDRRFREEWNKTSVHENFLQQLQIPDRKLVSALTKDCAKDGEREQEDTAENNHMTFRHCVKHLRSILSDNQETLDSSVAFNKLMQLENLSKNLEQFLEHSVGSRFIGADGMLPLLTFLLWRAKPAQFYFWISIIEILTKHRITGFQTCLLESLYAAYSACCSAGGVS